MGEGVAKELASKGWKVAVLDMNEKSGKAIAEQLGGIFIKTDVTNYDNQAAAFQKTWETYKQIDFVYANAGIVDTYPFYSKHDTLPPPKLPLLVQEVCLTGVVYSSYLAMHYMRQNPVKGGSIIMTSSGTFYKLSFNRRATLTLTSCWNLRITYGTSLCWCKARSSRLHEVSGSRVSQREHSS